MEVSAAVVAAPALSLPTTLCETISVLHVGHLALGWQKMARQTEHTKPVPFERGRRWQKQLAALMSTCAGRGERIQAALSAMLGRKANKSWGSSAGEGGGTEGEEEECDIVDVPAAEDRRKEEEEEEAEGEECAVSSSAPPVRSLACCMNLQAASGFGSSVQRSTTTPHAVAAVMQFITEL
jgi:hypothetical protein